MKIISAAGTFEPPSLNRVKIKDKTEIRLPSLNRVKIKDKTESLSTIASARTLCNWIQVESCERKLWMRSLDKMVCWFYLRDIDLYEMFSSLNKWQSDGGRVWILCKAFLERNLSPRLYGLIVRFFKVLVFSVKDFSIFFRQ